MVKTSMSCELNSYKFFKNVVDWRQFIKKNNFAIDINQILQHYSENWVTCKKSQKKRRRLSVGIASAAALNRER